jgi:hypothetical protein
MVNHEKIISPIAQRQALDYAKVIRPEEQADPQQLPGAKAEDAQMRTLIMAAMQPPADDLVAKLPHWTKLPVEQQMFATFGLAHLKRYVYISIDAAVLAQGSLTSYG